MQHVRLLLEVSVCWAQHSVWNDSWKTLRFSAHGSPSWGSQPSLGNACKGHYTMGHTCAVLCRFWGPCCSLQWEPTSPTNLCVRSCSPVSAYALKWDSVVGLFILLQLRNDLVSSALTSSIVEHAAVESCWAVYYCVFLQLHGKFVRSLLYNFWLLFFPSFVAPPCDYMPICSNAVLELVLINLP